jgi:hypothetical protein
MRQDLLPMVALRRTGRTWLALFFALLACLLPALAACGEAPRDDGSAQLQQATSRSELAETRATDSEARLQEAREALAKLQREHRAASDADASRAGSGGGDGGTGRQAARGSGSIFDAAARQSFEQLAASASGPVGIAVSPVGFGQPVEELGPLRSGVAWSTSKVPVAMAAIAAGVADERDLTAAITASDNAAATNLWNALGGGAQAAAAADEQLRAAGDQRTRIESRTLRSGFTPFGQTDWALADQVRFTAGMACTAEGGQVLGLMGDIVADQRWGLGATGLPAELKGGWGPGTSPGADGGYFDRQMGVVTIDGKPLAVALASQPSDGSHATGMSTLTQLARWIVEQADVSGLDTTAHC